MSVTRADLHCIQCGRPSIGIRCISCINGFFKRPDAKRVDKLLTLGFLLVAFVVFALYAADVFMPHKG